MNERLKEIENELKEVSKYCISRFDGTREEFVMYSVYVFTGWMCAHLKDMGTPNALLNLQNGLHALDVLLDWSRWIDKRSDDFGEITQYIRPKARKYMLAAYESAEDYSIITEALASRFTKVNIEGKTVTLTSKNETDYLRELVSRALGAQKSAMGFEPFFEEWNKLVREGIDEQEPQLMRIRRDPFLLSNHLDNLRANQLHVGSKRLRRLYDYYLRKNRGCCEFDASCDLGGFTVSDYVKVLSAVESLATENYIKCFSLYSDPVLSQLLHCDVGRLHGVEGTDVKIELFSYWSLIADGTTLVSRVAKLTGITYEVVQAVVRFMTFDFERGGHIIESPIVEICDKLVLLPFLVPSFNLMGMLPNKLCSCKNELYNRLMKEISQEKIEHLAFKLREAGFEVGVEIPLKEREHGRTETDIDILVHDPRENAVLLIEHKAKLVPYVDKQHYVDKDLRRAEEQLSRAMEYISAHRERFCADCRIDPTARFETCILMANNLGSSNSGVRTPVITTEKMEELIEGSHGSLARIFAGLENEKYMQEVDTSAYYVGKQSYGYAGYTFVFDALKYR